MLEAFYFWWTKQVRGLRKHFYVSPLGRQMKYLNMGGREVTMVAM